MPEFEVLGQMEERTRGEIERALEEPDLLTEEEFETMVAFARDVEARPVREYLRHGPVSGGPKRLDPDVLVDARVELRAAKLTHEYHADLLAEAEIILIERMERWLRAGVPVQFIAEAVGYNHRSQVYRDVNTRLPRLRREREARRRLLEEGGG